MGLPWPWPVGHTSSYPEVTRWWISGNSRACFCYVSRRLLQCSLCMGAEDGYRQAATSVQCCRPCGQRHTEVWSWSDVTPSRWSSLAGCARERYSQDGCHGVPLSSWSGTSVPRWPSHHILPRRFSASPAFRKPSPAHRTSLSTQRNEHIIMAVGRFRSPVRRSGTRCLTSSEIRRVVLTVLNSFLRQSCLVFTNVTSALEVFLNVLRYINPRFTYLLTWPWVFWPCQHC